jgi:3',5'-nucleoside bisphosphate phosphatase
MALIDLHTHTDRSDGSTPPDDLVRQAAAAGLRALAIADHDTLEGYDAACLAAPDCGVELVCAVEVSTRQSKPDYEKRERSVHVLGYWLSSCPTAEFRRYLETQQASRRTRNVELVAKLRQLGVSITVEDAEVYGRNQVGRPHFARVLLDKGYVSSLQEAFDVYLADEAQARVERNEPAIEEGIRRIKNGGGIAALAHPVRLPQRGPNLERLVEDLLEAGLDGIEVYHSQHSPADCAEFARIARRFGLIPTGGTDYHGENKPGIRLGSGIGGNVRLSYSFLEKMRDMSAARRQAKVGVV